MGNVFLWLLFGGLVGWVASMIMKKQKRGLIRNILLGLLGALVGGWLASLVGLGTVERFTFEGFGIALAGAILLVWIFGGR